MINIVTGYQGNPHLEAAEQGLFNAGICGNAVVLPTNNRLAYTLNSNNSITISSGDLVNQGRHITIPYNSSETVTIENGKTGYKRIDTVVVRYSKNIETSVESSEVLVIKGTAVTENLTAQPPEISQGNIFGGAVQDDFPLYDIHINGLNVEQVVPRFSIIMSAAELTGYAQKYVSNNSITAYPQNVTKLTADNEAQKIELSPEIITGDKLSIENGSIKIGTGIKTVLIQGKLIVRSSKTHNGTFNIYKNNYLYAYSIIDICTSSYANPSITARLLEVNEGDYISIYVKGSENDMINNDSHESYITVQAIE